MTSTFKPRRDPSLHNVLHAFGGVKALAGQLGLSHQAVSAWRRVPLAYAPAIGRAMGLKSCELRPDLPVATMTEPVAKAISSTDARLIARGHLAAYAAELVVAGYLGVSRAIVARTQGRARRLAVYVAATAVEDVCRTTIARHFGVSHQAASKTMKEVMDQRDKDPALDAQLDELCGLTSMAFGRGG
jgi:DNA-binding transcriptional regulator YdaS (Cro superfamily)